MDQWHFATLWESLSDTLPDRAAVVCGSRRVTWRQWEDRSARLASAFQAAGLGVQSKIGLYLYNGIEYTETQFAAFKNRQVPINVNYRYLDEELQYLLENSDAEALVFHTSLSDRVARVMPRCPNVRLWVEVDDGGESIEGTRRYEELIEENDPAPRIERASEDLYMLYTGGTTGMPKGVMYEMGGMCQSFVSTTFPLLGMGLPESPAHAAQLAEEACKSGPGVVSIPACPMMHGTGGWVGTMMPHCAGATVVSLEGRSFDAHELWATAEREKATQLVIVGDAFARPMVRAMNEAKEESRSYDTSSIGLIISSGVMWTKEVKAELLEWGDFLLFDAMGSSEGSMGNQITGKGNIGETAKFTLAPTTKVFTEDDREVQPGSGETGMVAAGGNVPFGYYKDEAKSRATFRTIDGVRFSFPGDWATVEADGTITLLGRGSQCINSAGEKIYPEEVEETIKRHDAVVDCLVVGIPDEKFGQVVAAVASVAPGASLDAQEVIGFTRSHLSAFKSPKKVAIVDQVQRAPNGKADYKWARSLLEDS
jgi:acyl-CoA synthetase (AMP-forming)/AMP-acid ligase II